MPRCPSAAPPPSGAAAALAAPKPELPGSKLAALADFLRGHTDRGALVRRLHPAAEPKN